MFIKKYFTLQYSTLIRSTDQAAKENLIKIKAHGTSINLISGHAVPLVQSTSRLMGWQANLYSLYKRDQRGEIPNQNPSLRHPG